MEKLLLVSIFIIVNQTKRVFFPENHLFFREKARKKKREMLKAVLTVLISLITQAITVQKAEDVTISSQQISDEILVTDETKVVTDTAEIFFPFRFTVKDLLRKDQNNNANDTSWLPAVK